MTRYGMAVDTKRCVGCNSCAMACKVENNSPNGVKWNQAITEGGEVLHIPSGEYPNNLSMVFHTLSCMHCDMAACVDVCPTGASSKRPEDGIVLIDYDVCIGCKLCMEACPYTGVRTFIDGEPEWELDFAVGDEAVQPHQAMVVEKCTFCVHRIDRGERPACADLCRAMARYFGDLDDPDSEIAQVLASREYEQLLPERGTSPNLYLLK